MNTINEVKEYQKSIRGPIGKLLDNWFRFVPYFAIKWGFSANLVTFFALLLDVGAVFLMLNGWYFSAAVCVLLSYIGDISDGTIARYEIARQLRPYKKPYLCVPSFKKGYGQFLDETLGAIGFAAVVFTLGYTTGNEWLGFAALIAIFMMNITTAEAKLAIPTKKSISEKFQNHRFKDKFQIGFTCDIQRTLIALAIIFQSNIFLWLFVILGNLLWLSKFWIYRNQ